METRKRKRTRTRTNTRTILRKTLLAALQLLLIATPAAAQKGQQIEEHNTDLSAKLPALVDSIRMSEANWLKAKVKHKGTWRDGWIMSTYPSDFFIY